MTLRSAERPQGPVSLSRRQFLGRGGALVVALAVLPQALADRGWLDEAAAAELDLTRDTINGLVAFVTPGDDEYSVAQGVSTRGPGGIAAGTTGVIVETLDRVVPAPLVGGSTGATVPISGAVAQLLNNYAVQVNPAASRGGFVSPFARLSFKEKAEVFRRCESDPAGEGTSVRNLAGLLPAFPAFLAFSEAGVFKNGKLTDTPVGWGISGYAGRATAGMSSRATGPGGGRRRTPTASCATVTAGAGAGGGGAGGDRVVRDVIVIGAGGGGPVVAKELAAHGLDVLLLEAGARFLRPEREWSRLENDHFNIFTGSFRFGPSDRAKPAWQREMVQSSVLLQIAGVGGTTLHYLGNCPRAMPGVFRGYDRGDRDAYDRAHQFPFSYRELIPYYEWVEHTLPVQTAAIGTKERAFLRGARRMGLPHQRSKDTTRAAYRPQENAILQPRGTAGRTSDPAKLRHPQAQGCTFCGHCLQGCFMPRGAPRNLAAKRSTDNSYVPMGLTADAWKRGGKAVTLIADAFATRIVTEGSGGSLRARGVRWRNTRTGQEQVEDAKVVVLAAGCVENPRLWLNSGLPNANGWVGRGLTEHDCDWVVGLMPYYTGSSKGPGSAARCDYPGRGLLEHVGVPPAQQAGALTISESGMAGLYDNGAPVGAAGSDGVGRRVGADLMRILSHGVDRLLNINVYTDDDVEPHNRVTLSGTMPPDEHGQIPRVEIRRRARSKRTRANREFLTREAVRLLKAAGATAVYRIDMPPFILHIHSTMRMGENESDSVLDANAESRAVKRLFIGDNSALANGVGGVNPTLTTQALATRTAEKIFQLYFDGSAWVRSESPVPSIAKPVTRAVVERGL